MTFSAKSSAATPSTVFSARKAPWPCWQSVCVFVAQLAITSLCVLQPASGEVVNEPGSLINPVIYHNDDTHELDGAAGVVLSPDGQHLYVTASVGDALSVYDVASNGTLSNLRIYRNDDTHELDGATGVILSPDGQHLYITAAEGDALSVYDVTSDGALTNPRIYRNDGTHELDGALGVALSPNGQHLYVTA
ncbi:lactonase family protein, partial [Endozoicomonas numazuensis]